MGNSVFFDLDLMYPWIPGIFRGFEEVILKKSLDIQIVRYRNQDLVDISDMFYSPAKRSSVKGLLTDNPTLANDCWDIGLPCVLTSVDFASCPKERSFAVSADHWQMGTMAARKLTEYGYRTLGIWGSADGYPTGLNYKTRGFRQFIKESSLKIREVTFPGAELENGWVLPRSIEELSHFLRDCESPVGLAAGNVALGWGLLKALNLAGRRIPEEFGVIVVGDDPVLLNQCKPSLTGIRENSFELGRCCADLLLRQMDGDREGKGQLVSPMGVVVRDSLATNRYADPIVAKAMSYMESHLADAGNLDEISQAIHTSRATLLRRFKSFLGSSPSVELRRLRLQRALDLIQDHNTPFAEVSESCGFGLQSALSRAVREATGQSPSALRSTAQLGLQVIP